MKIGILQTGHTAADMVEIHGDYPAMFERLLSGNGFTFEAYRVVDEEFPTSVKACDGWLITGSRHGAYEDHEWIAPLEAFIREAYRSGIPIAGICFGHQIMAQALGGRVEKFSGGWGIGRMVYKFQGVGDVSLSAIHQDQIVTCPPDAVPIASNEFCKYAALAYRGNAISVQPHPEFTDEYVRDTILRRAGKEFPDEQAQKAIESLVRPADSPLIAKLLSDFFKEAARLDAA